MSKHETQRFEFDGSTYEPSLDRARLSTLARAVYDLMIDGEWRTLSEIQADLWNHPPEGTQVRGTEGGIGARLRDFRKDRWGNHTVDRRRRGYEPRGIFEYKLIDPNAPAKS